MIVGGRHSLEKFKGMRKDLCSLAAQGDLDTPAKDFKPINSFLKIRSLMGDECDYLLSICKVISQDKAIMFMLDLKDDQN